MELKQNQAVKNTLINKIERGDYITLSKVLDVPRETAVSRFRRKDENAVTLMREIVTAREKLIDKLKKRINGRK